MVEFLKESLALLASQYRIRVVRADSGFFDDRLLSFLEEQKLPSYESGLKRLFKG
jgi:hypothetical protein